jgi:hypothetical protein
VAFDLTPGVSSAILSPLAGVAEQADARDSKSCGLCSCGFDSHLRHLSWKRFVAASMGRMMPLSAAFSIELPGGRRRAIA